MSFEQLSFFSETADLNPTWTTKKIQNRIADGWLSEKIERKKYLTAKRFFVFIGSTNLNWLNSFTKMVLFFL